MSTVIKARSGPGNTQQVALNLSDLSEQQDRFLAQIRRQAAEILARAQEEAAEVRARAEVEGQEAAVRAVEQQLSGKIAAQMQTLVPALREAIDGIHHARAAWLAHWENSAVRVAAAIAGRIARRQIERDPKITLTLITEALELAEGSAEVRIHMNPADVETLGEQARWLAVEASRLAPAEVVPDPTVTPGGCRVETTHGRIDQTLEAQLARIEEELTEGEG